MSTLLKIVIFFTVASLFVFFRWYTLDSSLLVYNDMGRDYVALLNWSDSGKPPLLGPQTSVISYNQSAWYFYVLFPLFLVTQYWAFSSTLTLTLVALGIYGFLAYFLRNNSAHFFSVSLCMALLAIQPQAVLQNRFIWNPSFIPYFLLLSLSALLVLSKTYSRRWLAVFWTGIAFAVGFSYSAVPVSFLLVLYLLFKQRSKWLTILAYGAVAAGVILLPMVAFEVRHDFALTKLFISGQTTPQTATSFTVKSQLLQQYTLPGVPEPAVVALLMSLVVVIALLIWTKGRRAFIAQYSDLLAFSVMLLILVLSTFLLPVNIEKHYIFPLLVLGIFVISLLPRKISIVFATILALFWLSPANSLQSATFQPAIRTVSQVESCYQQFCADYTTPAYVSMESGILQGYHNAPDHQYFLRKAGCRILDIETSQDQADRMLVIEDNGTFSPGKTGYRELTLFGPYTLGQEKQCTEVLAIREIIKAGVEQESEKTVFNPQ